LGTTAGLVQQEYLQKQGWTMKHQLCASISSGSGRRVLIWLLIVNFNSIFLIGHLYRAGRSMNSLPSQILERCESCYGDSVNLELTSKKLTLKTK